jgi:hypothetical protein
MARLPVRSRFWKTIINPRRRHRVEGGLREGGRYEIHMSARRRQDLFDSLPESEQDRFDSLVPIRRRMRVRFRNFRHWSATHVGWLLNFDDLSLGGIVAIPLRMIRKIFYMEA